MFFSLYDFSPCVLCVLSSDAHADASTYLSTQSQPNRIAICCANSETITCAECSSYGKSDTSTFSCAIAPTKSSTYTKSYRGALTATYAAAIRATDFPAN